MRHGNRLKNCTPERWNVTVVCVQSDRASIEREGRLLVIDKRHSERVESGKEAADDADDADD